MSIKLKKEQINLSDTVCSKYSQTTIESDIIVPDIKPDILRIVQVSSSILVTRKDIQNDKVYISGVLHGNILYLPDTGESHILKSIPVSVDFSHSADIKDAKPGMGLFVDAECDNAEFTLVNSRKLNIKCRAGFSIRLTNSSAIELATGIDDNCDVFTKEKSLKIYNPCVDAERSVVVKERLCVPDGKPSVCEILKVSAKPCSTELKLSNNKAAIKGELCICTLYSNDEGAPEYMEHKVPFNEIVEIDGITENMQGELDCCIKDKYLEIATDSDGDKRILNAEFTLIATIRTHTTLECGAIVDAYSSNEYLALEKSKYCIEQLIESTISQCPVKESVSIPDYLPEISRLCDCEAVPTIENISIGENTITVNGYITCNILYMTADPSSPVCGFTHLLTFSQIFDVPGVTEETFCDAKVETEHIGTTIDGNRLLTLRAIVLISIKAINPCKAELISQISVDDSKSIPKSPSMTIYFVQKNDTLWDISKRYHISPDAILKDNGSEAEILKPGNRLILMRHH